MDEKKIEVSLIKLDKVSVCPSNHEIQYMVLHKDFRFCIDCVSKGWADKMLWNNE